MKIIQATSQDFNSIRNIVHSTINIIYPHYYPKNVVDFFLKHHSNINIQKAIDTETILLLEVDGTIVATGSLKKNEILRLFVLPEFQGLGYGTILMNELENIVFRDYSEILLDSSLPAYNLYITRGYTPIEYKKIITSNDDVLCYHIMKKSIIKEIDTIK